MAKNSKRQKDKLSDRVKNDEQNVFDRSNLSPEERRELTELRTMLSMEFNRMTAINDTISPFDTTEKDTHK